ncbi:MAG: (Fe-S)-binding protein [Nitrososphaerota archaeon]
MFQPFRESFALLPQFMELVFYSILILFVAIFIAGLYKHYRLYGRYVIKEVTKHGEQRLKAFLKYGLLQVKIISDRFRGGLHATLFIGTIILFIGTCIVFVDHTVEKFGVKLLVGDIYPFVESLLDFFGLLFVLSVAVLLTSRIVRYPPRIGTGIQYTLVLVGLLYVGISGFLVEGFRLFLKDVPWSGYSFIGKTIADMISYFGVHPELAYELYIVLWWSHGLVALTLIAFLPYSNLMHILTSSLNIYLSRPMEPVGKLTTPFNIKALDEAEEVELHVGFKKVGEMGWRDALSIYACTDCGRCEESCPAYESGSALSPRRLIQSLKYSLDKGFRDRDVLAEGVIEEEAVWACTTCYACSLKCPVLISPIKYAIEIRRAIVFEGKMDERVYPLVSNIARMSNPFGMPEYEKEKLVEELRGMGVKILPDDGEVEYLYWLGCAAFYDPRAGKVAKTTIRLLKEAGLNVGILADERCTGDPARRVGEEGRFQEQAYANVEKIMGLKVKKIVTHCPHCYNTLKNEYREFGLEADVVHHTQLLSALLKDGRFHVKKKLETPAVLHDSCYIGRVNGIYAEPRYVLSTVLSNKLLEFRRSKEDSFCCGAGGCNYWYHIPRSKRESLIRLEEAISVGAKMVVVECPYCLAMFEDVARVMGLEGFIVKDVAEVLATAVFDEEN